MEKIYLAKEELDQLKELQEKNNSIISAFGELEVSQQTLNKQKENLINSYNELKQEENKIAIFLQNKYGEGTIEIDTGEFVKSS